MQVGSTLITMSSIPSRVTGTLVSSSTCPMVTADITLSCNRRMSSPYSLALQRTVHALIYTTIYLHRILLLASRLCKSSGQEQRSVLHLHIQRVESRQLQTDAYHDIAYACNGTYTIWLYWLASSFWLECVSHTQISRPYQILCLVMVTYILSVLMTASSDVTLLS